MKPIIFQKLCYMYKMNTVTNKYRNAAEPIYKILRNNNNFSGIVETLIEISGEYFQHCTMRNIKINKNKTFLKKILLQNTVEYWSEKDSSNRFNNICKHWAKI